MLVVCGSLATFASAQSPGVVSLTPSSGTGINQVFTVVATDPAGLADLNQVQLLFNTTATGISACGVNYHPAENSLYLYGDSGVPSAAVVPGSTTQVSNSQCTLNVAGSSASTSGNNLTLNVSLTFSSRFTGQKNAYVYVQGNDGLNNGGWAQWGTWTVPAPPGVVSLTPSSGTGINQVFTVVATDPAGLADLNQVQLLFNTTATGISACGVNYHPAENSLYLYGDSGVPSAAVVPGSTTQVSNSQCTLNVAGSSVSTSGNNLTLNVSLTFSSRFTGQKNAYVYVQGNDGLNNGGWAQWGTWTTSAAVTITLAPQIAAIGTSQTLQLTASGDSAGVTWSVVAYTDASGGTAAAAGTIDAAGNYTPPAGSPSLFSRVTATSKTDPTKSASATINVVAPGVVSSTNNLQVAQYSVSPAASAQVNVQFGTDRSYRLTTWAQPTPQFGGLVNLFVAGMRASTLYHMRGVVQFADGTQFNDADQTFTTGTLDPAMVPSISVTNTPGMSPQSGVELLNLLNFGTAGGPIPLVATDLAGNILWSYNPSLTAGVIANPIKLLSNGHFLVNFSVGSPDGTNSILQEVDLGGNVIWQMTAAQLNAALAAASCAGCNITVLGTHHDFVLLPNGHLVVIAATQQVISGTTVTGDVLIDLDQNHNPVWLWNEFDHLDINRQPYMYPDWTHTNAVIYSPDDGNLIVSIRHQNWLVKMDYSNGTGTGNVLWRLGYQGDFTLLNGAGVVDSDPTDWFYAQHGPAFVGSKTAGQFSLVLFDNGDDRGVSVMAGGTCGVTGQPACYSTVPILQLDESARTATLAYHATAPDYSFFGGNAEVLNNSNVEFDESSIGGTGTNAAVYEFTQTTPAQTVWQMSIAGQYAYRGFRMPSLYPGVQW